MTTETLDSAQLGIQRGAGYEGYGYLITGPQTVVFAARVNQATPTGSYAQITYDTVSIGAYTDLYEGMDVRISHTNNIRKAFFKGRVRKNPTSTLLYVNETDAAITDNDYIFVVDNYPLLPRRRRATFFDYDLPYQGLPPVVKGMDSAYVVLTTDSTAEFSFTPTMQVLEKGASADEYLWEIPGATYTSGSNISQNITIEVDTPYNQWGRLTVTDSEGTSNYFVFTLTAGNPSADPFFLLCHDPVPVSSDWTNGFSTSVSFWRGMEDILDGSRVTHVVDEIFEEGSLGVRNIRFVGYLKSTTGEIRGDDEYGQIKEVSCEYAGFLQLAGETNFDPIGIRHTLTPANWDDINTPTYARNITHVLRHSTLLNLACIDFGTIDDTYFSGNTNVPEPSLMDSARKISSEVNGYLIQNAGGALFFVRDPRLGTTDYRNSLPVKTETALNLGDGYTFTLTYAEEKVGKVEVGFASMQTDIEKRVLLSATAPASGGGKGQGQETIPNQLLAAGEGLEDALAEARQRTGDLYALANTRRTLEIVMTSGWGFIIATPGEWYNFVIDAEDDPRGIGVEASERWLCVSVNMTVDRDGTQSVTARFTEETRGGDALIEVSIAPETTREPQFARPTVSPYPALDMAPSINYDSTDPTNRIRRDPFSGMQLAPWPADEVSRAAKKMSKVGSRPQAPQLYFNFSGDRGSGFLTTLGAKYTIELSGSARIVIGAGLQSLHMVNTYPGIWENDPVFIGKDGDDDIWEFTIVEAYGTTPPPTYNISDSDVKCFKVISATPSGGAFDSYASQSCVNVLVTGPGYPPDTFDLNILGGYGDTTGMTAQFTLRPTIPTPALDVYADAFYKWNVIDGVVTNVLPNLTGGLYIDGGAVPVYPPFDENHKYTIPFIGTGNAITVHFEDDDYTDNEPKILFVDYTGPGAGR